MAVVDLDGGISSSGTVAAPLAYTNKLSGGIASAATVFIASGLVSVVGAFGQPLFGQMIFGTETEVPLQLELEGEIGSSGVLSAALAVDVHLAGAATGGATFAAEASAQRDLAGSVSGATAFVGEFDVTNALFGDVGGTGLLAGDIAVQKDLAGAVTATGQVAGDVTLLRPAPTLKAVVEVQGVAATVSAPQISTTIELVSEIKISLAA